MRRDLALEEMIQEAFALKRRGLQRSWDGKRIEAIPKEEDIMFKLFKREDETVEQVAKQIYEEPSGKRPRVEDEDEDDSKRKGTRLAGDEPDDDDQMSPEDRKRRGMKFKTSFRDVVLGDEDRRKTASYDVADDPLPDVRGAEAGEDAMGREYSDAVYDRLGGLNDGQPDMSPIPAAGAGRTWSGDTRDLGYRPAGFMPGGEGESGRVGGEDRGASDVPPNRGNRESYELLRENIEPSAIPVRVGPNFLMNPQASGIAPAAGFDASQSDPAATVKVRKSRGGVFRSAVFGKKGDIADGFLG